MLAGATETTATLSWTAPGDDARQGTVTRYDVRYSLKALPEDWESAVRVTELPPPREGGAAESLVVAGLANDHVYFMALTATDEAGNTSGLSNVVQVHTGDPGPPDFIADLEATEIFPHAVTLRFTAPGDDGNTGRASSYRIRYQQIELTEENWEDAVDVSPTTNPREAGQVERIRIHDLNPEGLYFFGVRSRDDAGNQSPLSNVAEVRLPPDTVAPASIRDLEVVRTSFEKVRLAWTAPGDDEDEGRATAYEARWASERITDESWNHATSVGSLPPPSEAGVREEMALFGLPGGTTIWLAVRAEDALGNRSAVSNNVFALLPSAERVWRVVEDGSGDAPTVQAAIDSAADGAAVVVGPGRYFENLDLRGKEIYLVSAFGPEATILDGTSAPSPVVSCMGLETSDTVIEGFTITGGMGYQALPSMSYSGGGVYCFEATPTIRGNIIRENKADNPESGSWGGGVYIGFPFAVQQPEPTIVEYNVIEDNYASHNGGGIAIQAECIVQGNLIRGNRTGRGDGGGIYYNSSSPNILITNNTLIENIANDHGGGIYIGSRVPAKEIEVSWNVLVGNVALGRDAGVRVRDCRGGGIWLHGNAWIHHNTIVFNRADTPFVHPAAGALCVRESDVSTALEYNIIYGNAGGGVSTYGGTEGDEVVVRRNLLFSNEGDSISVDENYQVVEEENLFVDPVLCVDNETTRGHLATNSPALTSPFGIIGAVRIPGCDGKGTQP